MLELPVTAPHAHLDPTIAFEQADNLGYLHAQGLYAIDPLLLTSSDRGFLKTNVHANRGVAPFRASELGVLLGATTVSPAIC